MTLLEAKIEACLRELRLSVEEETRCFKVYKEDTRNRYERISYLAYNIEKAL